MKRLVLLACLCVAGCADDHPGRSRLAPGQQCLAVGDPASVPSGSRVAVDQDTIRPDGVLLDFYTETAGMSEDAPDWLPEHPDAMRAVSVTVLDGEAKGRTAKIARFRLRPID
jgi:hypothetical protein